MLTGTKLGRYEVRQKIGAGGMGEVYLANDEKLGRPVALKVMLPEFCSDRERTERFKHEARSASALNHPNIITIHEIGEEGDCLFIATEFVEGKTLREMIDRGELTLLDAVKVAEQVADALAVAHAAQIVHRDIKPENIMVREDGIVKILDFGLAKPIFGRTVGAEDATVRLVETQAGMVLGSVRYMSPEQARGKPTDPRTDVWSLGVVLYESITGENPFDGETISDSLAAVLHFEPPILDDIPEELQRIVRKALKKKAEDRYQSIKDFALDLRDLRLEAEHGSGENMLALYEHSPGGRTVDTREHETRIHRTISAENKTRAIGTRWSRTQETAGNKGIARRVLPVALILASAVLALGGWFVLPGLLQAGGTPFRNIQASRLTESGSAENAEISPDGRFAAYVQRDGGGSSLMVKQISTGATMTVVPASRMWFYQPSFSPDGEFIYYPWVDNGVGTLYRVSPLGGESTKVIIDVDSRVTLSPDGKRVAFIRHHPDEGGDKVIIANSDGSGGAEAFLETREVGADRFNVVDWSPDGSQILVAVYKNSADTEKIMQLLAVSVADKTREPLGDRNWYGVHGFEWLRDGSGVIVVGKSHRGENSQVWHIAYPSGVIRQVTSDTSDYGSVSVSADGESVVTTRVDTLSGLWSMDPRTREMKQLVSESKNFLGRAGLAHSPDGRILFAKSTGKDVNIFSVDETGLNEKQLTNDKSSSVSPAVSPDGRFVVFSSDRGNTFSIWRMNADGSSPLQLTNEPGVVDNFASFTPDSRTVLFTRQSSDGGNMTMMKVPVDGGPAVPVREGERPSEGMGVVSPDGKRFAYHTFHFDQPTAAFHSSVKIVPFDGSAANTAIPEQEFELETKDFRWAPDGKSLTLVIRGPVENISSLQLSDGSQQPLTQFNSGSISAFTWSGDGRKLFIVRSVYNSDLVLIKDGAKV